MPLFHAVFIQNECLKHVFQVEKRAVVKGVKVVMAVKVNSPANERRHVLRHSIYPFTVQNLSCYSAKRYLLQLFGIDEKF